MIIERVLLSFSISMLKARLDLLTI